MLLDSANDSVVTNDGATVLKCLDVQHPAAKLLVDASKTQDTSIGDGTTSVVLFCAELLRQAETALERGLHPIQIIQGYQEACEYCVEQIRELSMPLHTEEGVLVDLAMTTLSSKVLSHQRKFFADLAVSAIQCVQAAPFSGAASPLQRIACSKVVGGSALDSRMLNGVLIQKKVGLGCPKKIDEPKIVVSRMDLDMGKSKLQGAQIRVDSHEQGLLLSETERDRLRKKCKVLTDHHANCVFNSGPIHFVAEQWFAEHGVMCVANVDDKMLQHLAWLSGGRVVSSSDEIDVGDIGSALCVKEVSFSETKFIQVDGPIPSPVCTLILHGPSPSTLMEFDRSIYDVLCVLNLALRSQRYVGGAGSLFVELAHRIRTRLIPTLCGKSMFSVESFAECLESLPHILAQNGGFDAVQLMADLRLAHQKDSGTWFGIDMEEGIVIDVLKASPKIIEPALLAESILKTATDTCEQILRIDETIIFLRRPTASQMGIV